MPNDTTQEMELRMRTQMAQRTPEERLKMAASMYDAGRALLLAGLKQQHAHLTEAQLRGLVLARLYGDQFSPMELKRIAAAMPDMEMS